MRKTFYRALTVLAALLRKSAIAVGDTVGDAKDSTVQAAGKLGTTAQRWRGKD